MHSKKTLLIFFSFFTCVQTADAMLTKVKPLSFKCMQRTKKLINYNQHKNTLQLNMRSCTNKPDAIIQSTSKGHLPYVDMVLFTTVALLYLDHYGLCGAAANNDIWTTKMLIALGKDVNQAKGNCTPLSIASAYNHTEIENLLLNAGAKQHYCRCHPTVIIRYYNGDYYKNGNIYNSNGDRIG